MNIKVYYPSGNNFILHGKWEGAVILPKGENAIVILLDSACELPGGIVLDAGAIVFGDPRGVYLDSDEGRVLYNPRDYMEGMQKVWIDWLNEHSEWPAILELS